MGLLGKHKDLIELKRQEESIGASKDQKTNLVFQAGLFHIDRDELASIRC